MFGLKGRKDMWRLILPKTFIVNEIEEKYTNVLKAKHGFYITPIDFLNESIQKIQVFGINNAAFQQQQTYTGSPLRDENRIEQNSFQYPSGEVQYRSPQPALNLIDKTLNIDFRMSLGYLNYFLIFENFMYMFSRDTKTTQLEEEFIIEISNEKGVVYSKIHILGPIFNSMDMLDLDYSQPVAESMTFRVEFKYNNINFEFLDTESKINNTVINK